MRYTIKEFNEQFPTEDACLEYIFKSRYGRQHTCPKCGKAGFYRVKGRKCWACAWCGHQIHPLANTIFRKSETPLRSWFFALLLMSQSRNGVSAKEIQRHIGVTYKTAWRIQKQIRTLMAQEEKEAKLHGTVETDEGYMGGVRRGVGGAVGKTPVIGMVERKGRIRAKVVGDVKRATIMPLVRSNILIGTDIMTDEYPPYNALKEAGYHHRVINHLKNRYVKGNVHTNTIDGFWSQLKRSIRGTYVHVSPKYLQTYVDEFTYRYSRCRSQKNMFAHLLGELVSTPC